MDPTHRSHAPDALIENGMDALGRLQEFQDLLPLGSRMYVCVRGATDCLREVVSDLEAAQPKRRKAA